MFMVEIEIFNGCMDFFSVCDPTESDWQYAKVFDK